MSTDSSTIFLAGALSGLTEALVVQPVDMITVRQMINQGKTQSILDTAKSVYQEGGFLRFYRGLGPELAGMVPKSSAMFGTYELTRNYLTDIYGDCSSVAAVAGLASGTPEALIVSPFQLVKIRLQAKEHVGRYNGALDCVKKTVQQEGNI
jgi:solute carrier family 25 2-oxodicarboxylate transporter 21